MKRMALLALAIAFLPLAAFAQNEAVEVDGKETLSGLWKISFPAGVTGYMPGRGRLISASVESFCRLQQTDGNVFAVCLPGWGPDTGDSDLDGKDLHLAWGGTLARAVIDVKIESPSIQAFNGDFAIKIFGIRHDAPAPASARRLVPGPAGLDTAGRGGLLRQTLEELAAGAIVTPHPRDVAFKFGHQQGANQANTPTEIRSLGKVEAILYLGEGSAVRPIFRDADPARGAAIFPLFAFSAYKVEFANGERLCGIHQTDDGVLDGFVCV